MSLPVINLTENWPGMTAVLATRPDLYEAICAFSQLVLVGPDGGKVPEPAASRLGQPTLTQAERELIGTYVSRLNGCTFCTRAHEAVSRAMVGDDTVVNQALEGMPEEPRFRALLQIARSVQSNVRVLDRALVRDAIHSGATEADVYDTVVLAAAFCMFNRMVECLGTPVPPVGDPYYLGMAERISKNGYRRKDYRTPPQNL